MFNYPQQPTNINSNITEPSALYKKEVVKAITAILLFIFAYLILIGLAAAIALFCIKIGIGIIFLGGHFIAMIAGAGIILIGIFIFFFVIKFIFSSYKTDRSNLVEITENEQPQLFQFIKQITNETQAPFPKKIYLSNEVNASVFYDSSFWSMFFPVRKNLLIGLGLVNSVNLSEFKAILAHEFGHFSQRSMKVGSYIYNSNRIIHNLLYDNGGYFRTLQTIANVHYILYLCMYCVIGVVKVIQKILNEVYLFINKQNMKLSREMEFHADSVAASVAGSTPLIHSLYRLELAESSFSTTLGICNLLLTEKKQEKNIYPSHHLIMNEIAKENKIQIVNNLPAISKDTFADFDTTRINIDNQWASHPSTQDREQALLKLNVKSEEVTDEAWSVFVNKEDLQQKLTAKLYEVAGLNNEERTISHFAESKYFDQTNHYTLPQFTQGYWDNKGIPNEINIDNLLANASIKNEDIYTPQQLKLSKQLNGILSDCATLEAIINKNLEVSSFDFDGNKYNKKNADSILETLKLERSKLEDDIKKADADILSFHYQQAKIKGHEEAFGLAFNEVIEIQQKTNEFESLHQEIINTLTPLFQGVSINMDDARIMVTKIQNREIRMKEIATGLLKNEEISIHLKVHTKLRLENLLSSARTYLVAESFQDHSIRELIDSLVHVGEAFNEISFSLRKKLFSI